MIFELIFIFIEFLFEIFLFIIECIIMMIGSILFLLIEIPICLGEALLALGNFIGYMLSSPKIAPIEEKKQSFNDYVEEQRKIHNYTGKWVPLHDGAIVYQHEDPYWMYITDSDYEKILEKYKDKPEYKEIYDMFLEMKRNKNEY